MQEREKPINKKYLETTDKRNLNPKWNNILYILHFFKNIEKSINKNTPWYVKEILSWVEIKNDKIRAKYIELFKKKTDTKQ